MVDGPDGDDVLDIGTDPPAWVVRLGEVVRRRRRAVLAAGAVLAAPALVAGAVLIVRGPAPIAGVGSAVTPPASTRPAPQVIGSSGPIQTVLALARQPLNDYVRQTSAAGSCAPVSVGTSPARAIAAVIARAEPGYLVTSVGRTLDQFTGLCSIQVQATRAGDVVVFSVSSPAGRGAHVVPRLETGIVSDGTLITKYALAVTPRGWTVLVGATGTPDGLPSARDLLDLAQVPSLTW